MESEQSLDQRPTRRYRYPVSLDVEEWRMLDKIVEENPLLNKNDVLKRAIRNLANQPLHDIQNLQLLKRIKQFTESGIVLAKRDSEGNLIEVGPLDLLQ